MRSSITGFGSDGKNYVIEEWCTRETVTTSQGPVHTADVQPFLCLPDRTPVNQLDDNRYEIMGYGITVYAR